MELTNIISSFNAALKIVNSRTETRLVLSKPLLGKIMSKQQQGSRSPPLMDSRSHHCIGHMWNIIFTTIWAKSVYF